MIRLKNRTSSPKDHNSMSRLAYDLVKGFGVDVGNLRVSSSAVELDLLMDSTEHLADAIKVLEDKFGSTLTTRQLDTPTPIMEKDDAVRLGINLFNEERFWESHEALESAWRSAVGNEKEILQGIILVAAALVHLQKGEDDVALSVLGRAHMKLRAHHGSYLGIDIDAINEKVARMSSSMKPSVFRIS